MYKVMIVDDEPIIVRGLVQIIDWKKWDCEVVATAGSGLEGLEMIEKWQPDILFSDISMPELDGLHMIENMKSRFQKMQITILTGYRDFDYAQTAIRLGVTRFLLKPSRMDEIEEAISAMMEKLKKGLREGDGTQPEEMNREAVRSAGQQEAVNRETAKQEVVQRETAKRENAESEVVQREAVQRETAKKETVEKEAGSRFPGMAQEKETELEEDTSATCFIVRNALSYMEENYGQRLKLADVADQIYVSQWHLSKLLNKHTGQSFSDILNHIRIEHAKELLADPSLRICDIAEEVGFLDMAHFSRVFKKQAGLSANEYRNTRLG